MTVMAKGRKFLSRSGFTFFMFTAFLFILSFLASKVNPQSFWPLAYFGLLFPLLYLAILMFFLYWLFRKKRKVILPLLLLILAWPVAKSFFNIFPGSSSIEDTNLVVLSYNVQNFGAYVGGGSNLREEQFKLIENQDADIVCFQEFYTKDNFNTTEDVAEAIDMPYYYFQPGISLATGQKFGLAIYSKYPMESKTSVFREKGNMAISANVIAEEDTITVYNTHLASIHLGSEDHEYIEELKSEGTKATDGKRSKEIAKKLKAGFIERGRQAKMLTTHSKDVEYPVILSGDFNDMPTSYTYHAIRRNLNDSFLEHRWGIGNSYSKLVPILRIDHIFYSSELKSTFHKTVKENHSDHFPVVAGFQLDKADN